MNDSPPPAGPHHRTEPPARRGGLSSYIHRTFASFSVTAFRWYYLSLIGFWSPMQMQMLARSLLIYDLTGSGTILGLMSLAGSIPMVVISLWGGVLADRLDKKAVLIWSQLGSGVLSALVGVLLTTGYLSKANPESWWVLVVSSAFQGTIFGLMMPSRAALMPDMVGYEKLMNAISLNNLGMNFFRIAAPAATGFIIAAWGYSAVYYAMAGLYLFSTIFLIPLPKFPGHFTQARSTLHEVADGVRYIRKETVIMMVLVFTLVTTILGQPFNILLPMFTENPHLLGGGPSATGIVLAVSGVGAIVVSLFLAVMPNRRRGFVMLWMGLIVALSLVGFSFLNAWAPALIMAVFIGLGQTGQISIGSALAQYHVDPAYRGRVMSFMQLGFGLASLGTVFGGVLADTLGIQWSLGLLSIALAVFAVFFLVFGRQLRALD